MLKCCIIIEICYIKNPMRKVKNIMNLKEFFKIKSGEIKTFPGGIHPDDAKEQTNKKEIINLDAPDILVFPLSQHIGAPAQPCVKVDDEVKAGQKIGEASGFVSANIHSSVSGKVIAIEPKLHSNGTLVNSVIIENDRNYTSVDGIRGNDYKKLSSAEIIDIVREAGIVGMGGATFPTHVKLSPPKDKKIEYAIINGAECEPYLTSDHRAMLETPDDIILGLKIIMKIFGLKTGYIAVESNKPDAISVMKEYASKETECEIKVITLQTKYPQGSEKHLIYAVTGRRVPRGKLPMDVGAVVDNIDTCAAIARAVSQGLPLTQRIVTVSGDCVSNPSNYRVKIGTPVSYLLEKAGGLLAEPKKVIMGGPMMGTALSSTDVPVIKGTSGILAFSEKNTEKVYSEESCLRCGRCVKACPMKLLPNMLKLYSIADNFEMLEKYNAAECIECGSCSYVCPALQHPVQSIRIGKAKLREWNMKKQEEKNNE